MFIRIYIHIYSTSPLRRGISNVLTMFIFWICTLFCKRDLKFQKRPKISHFSLSLSLSCAARPRAMNESFAEYSLFYMALLQKRPDLARQGLELWMSHIRRMSVSHVSLILISNVLTMFIFWICLYICIDLHVCYTDIHLYIYNISLHNRGSGAASPWPLGANKSSYIYTYVYIHVLHHSTTSRWVLALCVQSRASPYMGWLHLNGSLKL